MIREFKEFAMRGNIVELAVAVILALAFAAVITSFVDDVLMQMVAAVFGQPDFSGLSFTINESEIRYGAFLNAVLAS